MDVCVRMQYPSPEKERLYVYVSVDHYLEKHEATQAEAQAIHAVMERSQNSLHFQKKLSPADSAQKGLSK